MTIRLAISLVICAMAVMPALAAGERLLTRGALPLRYGPSSLSRVIVELPQDHEVVVQLVSPSPGPTWVRVKTLDPTTGRPTRGWVEGRALSELAMPSANADTQSPHLPEITDAVIARFGEPSASPVAAELVQRGSDRSNPPVPERPQVVVVLPGDLSVLIDQVIAGSGEPLAGPEGRLYEANRLILGGRAVPIVAITGLVGVGAGLAFLWLRRRRRATARGRAVG